jgi:hypothetical protein
MTLSKWHARIIYSFFLEEKIKHCPFVVFCCTYYILRTNKKLQTVERGRNKIPLFFLIITFDLDNDDLLDIFKIWIFDWHFDWLYSLLYSRNYSSKTLLTFPYKKGITYILKFYFLYAICTNLLLPTYILYIYVRLWCQKKKKKKRTVFVET